MSKSKGKKKVSIIDQTPLEHYGYIQEGTNYYYI